MRDIDVRLAIRQRLRDEFSGDLSTNIVEEMGIWSSTVRIDVAVINGLLHGFELKSERDTLARLPAQVNFYNGVFDKVTLVVAEKHIDSAKSYIPSWWGIISARQEKNGRVVLESRVDPQLNPDVSAIQLSRILWRAEALAILEKHQLDGGVRSKPVEILAQRLAEHLPLPTLRFEVRETLKKRVRSSRQIAADKAEVAVHSNANPRGPISRTGRVLSNLLNALIRPASW
jgi:hypothetical protein